MRLSDEELCAKVAWRPIDEWDKRDDLVFLLVDYRDGGDHPIEDVGVGFTVGHNSDHNVGAGEGEGWKFAGWCWSHDHYTQGRGKPIAWRPIPSDFLGDHADRIERALAGGTDATK